jgi:hypothetical protein
MQKALPEVCAAVGTLPDLFAANLRTVLRIRIAAIATRISARKLNEGISQYSESTVAVTSSIGTSVGNE